MQVQVLNNGTVVPVDLNCQSLYQILCEIKQDQVLVKQDQRKLWSEVDKINKWRTSINSWRQKLGHRCSRMKGQIGGCLKQLFGGLYMRTSRGRPRSQANEVLLKRAILYRLSCKGCSLHNACYRTFVRLPDGYANARGLYEYAKHHPAEVEQIEAQFARASVSQQKTFAKLREEFDVEHASLLRGIVA